jgi:hypothetical protein
MAHAHDSGVGQRSFAVQRLARKVTLALLLSTVMGVALWSCSQAWARAHALRIIQARSGRIGRHHPSDPKWAPRFLVRILLALPPMEYDVTIYQLKRHEPAFEAIKRLPGLRAVRLTGATIGNDGLSELATRTNLESLYVEDPTIDDDGLAPLQRLRQLKSLGLPHTAVRGRGLAHVEALPELLALDLSRSSLDDEGMTHIGQMRRLLALRIQDTRVSARGVSALANLRNLELVFLGDVDLSLNDVDLLLRLPRLTQIYLQHRGFTRLALADMRDSLAKPSPDGKRPSLP